MKETALQKNGFTLVELVVVMLVLAVLSFVVIPRAIDFSERTSSAITESGLGQIQKAIMGDRSTGFEGFLDHMGRLPSATEGLAVLLDSSHLDGGSPATYNPITERGWNGPYLDSIDTDSSGTADSLEDAWGNAFNYDPTADPVVIWSNGPDEVDDSADPDEDDIYIELGTI
jgi:prepilin-type N-terminal cleavage/methylation domain-containing protein